MILAVFSVLAVSVFADNGNKATGPEKTDGKWTEISYVNVPILKILEGRDGYAVIYQKNRAGVGSVVIPKSWANGNPEKPRKLKFRAVNTALGSYMTIVKNKGEFQRVILSLPVSKQNSIWGLIDYRKKMEGLEKDTLEDLEL